MLDKYSDEQLQAELDKREYAARKANKPRAIDNPDLTQLRATCQSHIDMLYDTGYSDDDSDQYIYEEAMKAIFGNDVFDWINKQLR